MPIIFFILSITLLCYADKEPSCMYGAVIFAVLGVLLGISPEFKNKKHKS
jgi:hypothetical protein